MNIVPRAVLQVYSSVLHSFVVMLCIVNNKEVFVPSATDGEAFLFLLKNLALYVLSVNVHKPPFSAHRTVYITTVDTSL